jgi:CRISPR/Cas system-associated endoribonuclease Cas2
LANGFLESGLKKIVKEKGGMILAYLFSSARFLISECKAARRCLQVFRVRYDIQGSRKRREKEKKRGKKGERRTANTVNRGEDDA